MNEIGSIKKVREMLQENQFRIKKHYGQNFITDQNLLKKIVDSANIGPECGVIEVGPGFGALTQHLVVKAKKVLAFEIDKELIPLLQSQFINDPGFILIHQDILDVHIDEVIHTYLSDCKEIVVVANLPYYITTPILMRFLETSQKVSRLILMMQHEVAMRITGKPNTKDYNALSIVIQYLAKAKLLFKVPRTVFIPAPNVDSAIVHLEIKETKELNPQVEPRFFDFVHQCFTQRRKTLMNNLKASNLGKSKEEYEISLTSLGIALDARSEQLDVLTFLHLFHLLGEHV
jgi:16S rRNA (adenine1518-N6/adenine1519-N6)-dimethyltransferase